MHVVGGVGGIIQFWVKGKVLNPCSRELSDILSDLKDILKEDERSPYKQIYHNLKPEDRLKMRVETMELDKNVPIAISSGGIIREVRKRLRNIAEIQFLAYRRDAELAIDSRIDVLQEQLKRIHKTMNGQDAIVAALNLLLRGQKPWEEFGDLPELKSIPELGIKSSGLYSENMTTSIAPLLEAVIWARIIREWTGPKGEKKIKKSCIFRLRDLAPVLNASFSDFSLPESLLKHDAKKIRQNYSEFRTEKNNLNQVNEGYSQLVEWAEKVDELPLVSAESMG